MILQIENVLSFQQLEAVNQLIDTGQFEDGKLTAGWNAQSVKENRQWQASDDIEQQLDLALSSAISNNPEFVASAYPKTLQSFLITESHDGGHYGLHIDDALMAAQQVVRTDVSCTIFLSAPTQYQGGELEINMQGQCLQYKLSAGSALIYPSTSLHQVMPVTSGCRRVAVSWAESYVRSAANREILYDLDRARKAVMQQQGKTPEFDLISKSHANLLRQWADT